MDKGGFRIEPWSHFTGKTWAALRYMDTNLVALNKCSLLVTEARIISRTVHHVKLDENHP